ncbi:FG-GAP repeat domain-containing protein [Glycomyces tritici]|uniref:VCBS repeat-containing protein n=1 Tax=Glycomyces tritici TaxID=2665176 RepID=A0ABT7YR48_9ACTN|nr:VCBS repeat-containing protein [Glycomyces tritici]MDN3240753.1 VCBS repeat-containing protein [Glycomyces tritici]
MSPDSPRARRAGLRLLAAAAAGCTAAAAFAVPASAADIPGIEGDPVAALQLTPDLDNPEMAPSSMTVDYTPATPGDTATHAVVTELVFDDPYGVLDITTADPACDVSAPATIVCASDAGPHTEFLFEVLPASSAEDDTIDYTFKATVDGTDVAGSSGAFGVVSDYDVHNPYAHGDFAVTEVGSGDSVKVKPVFYQDFDLAPTAAAVVISFTNPLPGGDLNTSGLAKPVDSYNNCRTVYDGATATGVECVITDFTDAKGQFLTLATGMLYDISSGMVGPLDVCDCRYSVSTINADALAEYDDLSWTGTTLELTTAPAGWDGAEESIAYYWGGVTLTTKDRTYDLEVSETFIEGMVGNTVTVTTKIENNGPAGGPDLNPESDSYLVRAQLPEGTELVRVDSDSGNAWDCYGPDELDEVYAATTTALERFDFACALDKFGFGARPDITYTVKITDTTAFQGAVEIGAVYEGDFEGNPESDFALIYSDAYEARYDYNQDDHEDLLVIRKSDGALRLYPGTSAGTYGSALTVATGWAKMDIVMAGDLTGDDLPDLVARDNTTGTLYTYPGNGTGGLRARITVGTGWGKVGQISVGYYDGDGIPDLYATSYADGNLYYYPGLGNGKFGAREFLSEQWDGMDVITSIGDVDNDGYDEFLSRWNFDGHYYIFSSQGEVYELNQALHTYGNRFEQTVGVGDLDRDGSPDFAAADLQTGELLVRSFDPNASSEMRSTVVGKNGWNTVRLPVTVLDRNYDIDYDGYSDFFAQRKSDGDLFLYWGTGKGHGERVNICDNCNGITMTIPGGDYTSDGRTDMLIRTYAGELRTIAGSDASEPGFQWDPYIAVGPGWNAMGTITGGHDYNSDGKDDLIAVHSSTGNLYLYPGRGDGTFGSRALIGNGWSAMREVTAVGDLDHNGHADMLAISKSDSCLYFYNGTGSGKFKSRVKVGCGWKTYEAITAVGDFNRDGHADFFSRRTDGILFLYPGNGTGGHGSRVTIGNGWNAMNIA